MSGILPWPLFIVDCPFQHHDPGRSTPAGDEPTQLERATTQLSTGWRIHFSAGDANGSAINSKLVTQARRLNMDVHNKDISMMQTANSAVVG
jgi:hypothetical protein